ncbi:Protein-glutamate methylesterase/protein-glutamine glutaminase [Dyadobacter sp. CECT 9623]|uniref:Protein-glutamate methylesterase/protein-glutamine glutaminase n=1 Tax=Dyadobacter linearis TaxID=2823330 RepID=A0ABN7R9U8_9BACT|nr:response regulator [Dyadobacter sp. CECT 9623]CAG5070507.1 Protein-glutamate methylesterase/protein-glutamine glutaminase [Dyadobacter sp. CECT 9623]
MKHDKHFRILLADDDDDDTFLFREALEQVSFESQLFTAANGMELMDTIVKDSINPDLIFLDMNMPVKNGLECLEEIRATPGFEKTPIVVLSTSVAQYLWESAYKGGANLYIQKPTSFSGLVNVLHKCLFQSLIKDEAAPMEQFLITN